MQLQYGSSLLGEAPIAAGDAAIPRVLPDEAALLDAIDARRIELGLSNTNLEQIAGLTAGHATKALGPSRKRSPTLATIDKVMLALGLSFVLVCDSAKIDRMSPSWRRRNEAQVRHRLGATTLRRACPAIMGQLARKASRPRWAGVDARTFLKAMRETGV
jgi:DNA-binding phage protein